MHFTTPPPCIEITRLVPELIPLARETVRLHPRRTLQDGPQDASKFGGLIWWPYREHWPMCHGEPYVAVVQLNRRDVPELHFPDNRDIFQVLWCPEAHHPTFAPLPAVFWRNSSDIEPHWKHPSRKAQCSFGDSIPVMCSVTAERVKEYPAGAEFVFGHLQSFPLFAKLDAVCFPDAPEFVERQQSYYGPTDMSGLYGDELSTCPGTKLGGYPDWIQSPEVPMCDCGEQMEYLLTIASGEFDSGGFRRWMPKEDQERLAGKGKSITWSIWSDVSPEERYLVDRPHGMMLGDCGSMLGFVCRKCKTWPMKWIFQSS